MMSGRTGREIFGTGALALAVCALAACGPDDTGSTTHKLVPCGGEGTICTYAGTGERAFNGDGLPLAESTFDWPMDLEFSPKTGDAFILDWNSHRVRHVRPDG